MKIRFLGREGNAMKLQLLALTVVGAVALVLAWPRPSDNQAIIDATRQYVQQTASLPDVRVDVEQISGDYARALVSPIHQETDPATVFLKREDGHWIGLTMGTAFPPEEYNSLGIPAAIRADS